MIKKIRNINLDLIRCAASFSVLSVHFFLHSGYYYEVLFGKRLYIATLIRTASMICVPLFMILTGYLMNSKVLSCKYYAGLKKTLSIYLLSTIAILIYRIAIAKEALNAYDILINITSFSQYSWYIGMYIGLFLLIPFLNLIYNNLFTKKTKSLLLITMILLTAAHSLVNSYAVLIPDWWINIYPITYYFIGAYIFEYKDDIKISLKLHFLLIIICIIAFGTYCYYRSYNDIFIWGQWSDWGGFINSIDTVLIFVFLLRLDLTNIPAFLKRGIMYISEISLGIYLVSWIFDNYNYPKLIEAISDMPDRLPFYLVIVPFNFICSSILSAIIYMIDRVISKSIKKYIDFLKSKTEIPV